MHRTARRTALCPLSGIRTVRPPRGGWHRNDPADGGDGSSGHANAGGGGTNDDGNDAGKADDKNPEFDGDFDAERAKRAIAAGREEAKKAKADAKAARDQLAAVLKAAGLAPDGKADPEAQVKTLTDRAEAAEKRVAALATRDAVSTAAEKHQANAGELLDSRKFADQLAELDATADDYGDKVADLVKRAVKDNPAKYGTTAAKGGTRSGSGDHTGGGNGPARSKDLNAAVARRLAG